LEEVALFGRRLLAVLVLAGVGSSSVSALAQEDLNRGKTPAQLFASDCADCHRNARALSKRDNANTLAGFLRVHYTASRESAAALANYLVSLGPDPRGAAARPAARAKPAGAREQSKSTPASQPAAKPAEGAPPTPPEPVPQAPASAPAAPPSEPPPAAPADPQ
jgi:hypothetical protein